MQGYTYSVFSGVAIVIHLIINYDLLIGRKSISAVGPGYRGFLLGILAYYVTDVAWGILAGLGWTRLLYFDTIFFFLSLVLFVFMWGRFVIAYLDLGNLAALIIAWFGYAILAFNLAALAANPFTNCFFHFDAQGNYLTDWIRDPAFYLLIIFNVLIAFFVFVKAVCSQDSVRRRSMMVFLSSITMALAMLLQIVWPLTPFTALGCLVGNCFLHVFVIQDEQTAKNTAKLEQALERAHAAEKARSMFFSIVSHDIRTPLNAILGYSELLQAGISDPDERNEALESIRASGTTLLELVNDVLVLAKIDSGKMTLRPEPVLPGRLTDEVFASFRLAAAKKGIELINRTADVPAVLLDEHRFRQILFNLVGNAVKFTDRGSVTVAASYTDTDFEFSVSDTGCGIPPDMLGHILDPFVQVQDPSHSSDRAGGIGLGLSICNSLVKVMGGKLVVESELGKGSTFKAHIPNVETADETTGTAAKPPPDTIQHRLAGHVLVVDDSPVNRKVLTAFLKKAGVVSIDDAADGAMALEKLDSATDAGRPYDFIFTDLWMPKINGFELIEQIRADSRFARLPVFALTADTEFKRDARTRLFTGVLLKPVTYEDLVKTFDALEC